MNELVIGQQEAGLAISTETKELIQSSVADSILKRYSRLSEEWHSGRMLSNVLLQNTSPSYKPPAENLC